MNAIISSCGKYRYLLRRGSRKPRRVLCFVMLNPSTADAEQDDATIRRCRGFAERFGYDGLAVLNLFAYRSTDPAVLRTLPLHEAIGPENDFHFLSNAAHKDNWTIVCAWGADPIAKMRSTHVRSLFWSRQLWCLGKNKDGSPKHPLYLPNDAQLQEYP